MSLPPNLLCQREDCPVEAMMRAMEAWRAERTKAGVAPPQSRNDYAVTCKICSRTPKWERSPDGLVKVL